MLTQSPKFRIRPIFQLTAVICITSYVGTSIVDIIHISMADKQKDINLLSSRFKIIIGIGDLLYFNGSIVLYIILIYRLYSSFKSTIYAISRCAIIFFAISLILCSIIMLVYCIEIMVIYDITLGGYLWICIMGFDLFLNISMLTLFIYKLKQIIVDYYQINKELIMNEDGMNLQSHQKGHVQLIAKISNLGLFTILFNQLFYVCAIYEDLFKTNGFGRDLFPFITYSFRNIEGVINCVVLVLTFAMNEKLYFRMCRCCHGICENICLKDTKRRLTRADLM